MRPERLISLAMDLAELAQWSGQLRAVPELRSSGPLRPWSELSTRSKVHMLQVRPHPPAHSGRPQPWRCAATRSL
jgi:hypothetical protein